MRIVRHTKVDDSLVTGSVVIDGSLKNEAKDPVIEIFVSVRNKYKSEFCISVYPMSKNALGWAYAFIPANNSDGDDNIVNKFQDYLENKIGPEFEKKLTDFFNDPDGFVAYQTCVEAGEIEAANRVIKDFIYRSASEVERKALDRKAKKARKAELKALKERESRETMLKSLGIPATFRSVLL